MNGLYRDRLTARSKLRHPDKYKLALMCREKEEDGWECVRAIQQVDSGKKHFVYNKYDGDQFAGLTGSIMYEAIYEKEFVR